MSKFFLIIVVLTALISTPYRAETPVTVRAILQTGAPAGADPVTVATALQSFALEPVQVHFKFPATAQRYDGGGGMFTLRTDTTTSVHRTQLQAADWPAATYTHIEATMLYRTATTLPSIAGVDVMRSATLFSHGQRISARNGRAA